MQTSPWFAARRIVLREVRRVRGRDADQEARSPGRGAALASGTPIHLEPWQQLTVVAPRVRTCMDRHLSSHSPRGLPHLAEATATRRRLAVIPVRGSAAHYATCETMPWSSNITRAAAGPCIERTTTPCSRAIRMRAILTQAEQICLNLTSAEYY